MERLSADLGGSLRSADGTHIIAVTLSAATKTSSYMAGFLGLASAVSVSALAVYVVAAAVLEGRQPISNGRVVRSFLQTDFGFYLSNLFLLHFGIALSFSLDIHWARKGVIVEGSLCSFQGGVKVAGALGPPLWNLALASQTFYTFVVQRTTSRWARWPIAAAIWILLVLPAIVGFANQAVAGNTWSIFGPSVVGCSLRRQAFRGREMLSTIDIINSTLLGLSFGAYVTVACKICGLWPKGSGASVSTSPVDAQRLRSIAFKMSLYPVLYTCVTVPQLSVAQISSAGGHAPLSLVTVATALLAAAGFLEVILFLWSRSALLSSSAVFKATLRSQKRSMPSSIFYEPGYSQEPCYFVELEAMQFTDEGGGAGGKQSGRAVSV